MATSWVTAAIGPRRWRSCAMARISRRTGARRCTSVAITPRRSDTSPTGCWPAAGSPARSWMRFTTRSRAPPAATSRTSRTQALERQGLVAPLTFRASSGRYARPVAASPVAAAVSCRSRPSNSPTTNFPPFCVPLGRLPSIAAMRSCSRSRPRWRAALRSAPAPFIARSLRLSVNFSTRRSLVTRMAVARAGAPSHRNTGDAFCQKIFFARARRHLASVYRTACPIVARAPIDKA